MWVDPKITLSSATRLIHSKVSKQVFKVSTSQVKWRIWQKWGRVLNRTIFQAMSNILRIPWIYLSSGISNRVASHEGGNIPIGVFQQLNNPEFLIRRASFLIFFYWRRTIQNIKITIAFAFIRFPSELRTGSEYESVLREERDKRLIMQATPIKPLRLKGRPSLNLCVSFCRLAKALDRCDCIESSMSACSRCHGNGFDGLWFCTCPLLPWLVTRISVQLCSLTFLVCSWKFSELIFCKSLENQYYLFSSFLPKNQQLHRRRLDIVCIANNIQIWLLLHFSPNFHILANENY